MASKDKKEMKCSSCKLWIPATKSIFVPEHYIIKKGVQSKCPGSKHVPQAKRGFGKDDTTPW